MIYGKGFFLALEWEGRGRGAGWPSVSNISVAFWQHEYQSQGESSFCIAELIELIHILSQKARSAPASSRRMQELDAQPWPQIARSHLQPRKLFTLFSLQVHVDHRPRDPAFSWELSLTYPTLHLLLIFSISYHLLVWNQFTSQLERLWDCTVMGFKWLIYQAKALWFTIVTLSTYTVTLFTKACPINWLILSSCPHTTLWGGWVNTNILLYWLFCHNYFDEKTFW